jgi:protein-disulfide isomerase
MNDQSTPACNGDELADAVSDADHQRGPADATVTLVEYGDYECPDCLNSEPIVKQLQARMGGRLRVIFRHFPRNSIHPRASAAAEAAEAAAQQGRFWDMHESLFQHQRELSEIDLTHLALRLGLDVYRFQRDSESESHSRRVRDNYDGAIRSGISGTPTFFINGCRHSGSNDFDALFSAIVAAAEVSPSRTA